jgi:three-Cys-motif partner protein
MAGKNLHDKPFDECTLAKLGIFEDYTQAWLPVFVSMGLSPIHIFDFFAGTGYDKEGRPGSPIRILNKVREQAPLIFEKRVDVFVHLNEFEPDTKKQDKFNFLQQSVDEYLDANPIVGRAVKVKIYNEDFEDLFHTLLPIIKSHPSLVFLDQNGIKFLSPTYRKEFTSIKQTDFLYFAATSYLRRLGDTPEFKKHLYDLDLEELKTVPYNLVHRTMVNQLRQLIPDDSDLRLYPFSLLKGSNIYGLIFGATHDRAVDKFLKIAWNVNNENGEANFDINDEASKIQGKLFEPNLRKTEVFGNLLRQKVLSGEITDNRQAFRFSLDEGHPSSHAHTVLLEMKRENEISFDGRSPLVTYEAVHKKPPIRYKVIKK